MKKIYCDWCGKEMYRQRDSVILDFPYYKVILKDICGLCEGNIDNDSIAIKLFKSIKENIKRR